MFREISDTNSIDGIVKQRNAIFRNTFGEIETIFSRLGTEHDTRFEFECYDVGHLYNLKHFVDRGLARGPLFLQFVFGVLGLVVSLVTTLPLWLAWLMPLLAVAIALTIVNRIRAGLAELAHKI